MKPLLSSWNKSYKTKEKTKQKQKQKQTNIQTKQKEKNKNENKNKSWTGPRPSNILNMVELFHGSLFCNVFDIFEVLLLSLVQWLWCQFVA